MVKKSILFILLVLFLAGCNELKSYKEDALELWTNGAGDKYSIMMFKDDNSNSYSKETGRIMKLNKYKKFDAIYSYRDIYTNINYLKAWGAKEYPFYLIVSSGGIELITTSVNEIEQFFEKNGGQLKKHSE